MYNGEAVGDSTDGTRVSGEASPDHAFQHAVEEAQDLQPA